MSQQRIDKLTPEQEAKMPEYVKKWIGVATSCEEVDDTTTAEIVKDFRELIKLNSDVPLLIVDNPIEAWVACCLFEQEVPLENIREEMVNVFERKSKYSIPQASLPYNTTLLSYVFSFYDFMFNEVGVEIDEELMRKYQVWQRTSALWAIYPLENLTVVSRRPIETHINENNALHRDGGPALVFNGLGDFKIFALNGVRVPEYLAVQESHEIDIEKYTDETNADVKAEFIRKVGIERMLDKGKKIDTFEKYDQEDNPWWWKSEYELWDLQVLFPSLKSAPYLKMRNPTTGIWHVEGVSPKCKTLPDAIKERFGGRDMKIVQAA